MTGFKYSYSQAKETPLYLLVQAGSIGRHETKHTTQQLYIHHLWMGRSGEIDETTPLPCEHANKKF